MEYNKSENVILVENQKIMRREAEFARQHKHDTDEELMRYLKHTASELDHVPKKREILGYALIKSRLGPWPRVLEKAGLKNSR